MRYVAIAAADVQKISSKSWTHFFSLSILEWLHLPVCVVAAVGAASITTATTFQIDFLHFRLMSFVFPIRSNLCEFYLFILWIQHVFAIMNNILWMKKRFLIQKKNHILSPCHHGCSIMCQIRIMKIFDTNSFLSHVHLKWHARVKKFSTLYYTWIESSR